MSNNFVKMELNYIQNLKIFIFAYVKGNNLIDFFLTSVPKPIIFGLTPSLHAATRVGTIFIFD